MKISLNWIKNYIDLGEISAEEVIEKLTISGLEVEEIEDKGKKYENFVVGYVKEKKKHPNADKLSVCLISTGDEDFNVVCGAPNVEAGQKIAFAKIGAVVPDGGFKITKAKLRGEVSCGMICSEKELGLSDNHQGILVLDPALKEGTPLAEALNLNDIALEIGITPNRPDALSHIGVARDLAAIFNIPLKIPAITLNESDENITETASIEILNIEACPRYSAKAVKNVKIGDSPAWLKKKLTDIGLRPINNVVDVTNFILHEMGQPLHAFDLNRLSGRKIIVKNASEGESFTTLDSKERKLLSSDLVICDAEKPVAIAGVMGGENSEVTIETKDILIESAYFNPAIIRKTAKRLQLSTDASYRFERGTDPNNTVYAAERAAQLIAELGGGTVLKGTIDIYEKKIVPVETSLRYSRITKVLGYEIKKEEVKKILINLGFEIKNQTEEVLTVIVPTYRPDIEREIDLIEEVARINGYNNIPAVERISITLEKKTDQSAFKGKIRDIAIAMGFYEIISNSLQPVEVASMTGKPIEMLNPQSQDMAVLRTSLLQGALYAVAKSINSGEKDLMFFEVGNVFNKNHENDIRDFKDFSENSHVLFLITGKAQSDQWYDKERNFDIYDLKGFLSSFLKKNYLDNVISDSYYLCENKIFEQRIVKSYGNVEIGSGGKVAKEILKKFDINQDLFCFELDINALENIPVEELKFRELLKYPKVVRDCAFIVDRQIDAGNVISVLYKGSSRLLKHVEIFDIFDSEVLGTNKKSMAFSLTYFDESRTLKDEEVERDFKKSVNLVVNELKAEFRGN